MPLITTSDLSKRFGDHEIFSDVAFSIPENARIGFIGDNGCGKTTLLRILVGESTADSGKITVSSNLTIGYLPQSIAISFDKSPLELCKEVFIPLRQLQDQITSLQNDLSLNPSDFGLVEKIGSLQHSFEEKGGYQYESSIDRILQGLGLANGEENRPWRQLSGGQKMRAYLAKILLENPDLLIFDEPTNHLDIEAIEWLESFLKDFHGSVLMVSHDRYFLDQCVDQIWDMTPVFSIYHGNYSQYLSQREANYQRLLLEFEKQQEFIEKETDYIRRNIAGQNTRQAQGRRKRLERLISDSKITLPIGKRSMQFSLSDVSRSGDQVIKTKDVEIGYWDDQKTLFKVPDLMLLRNECAAIIGPNGTGKSTFLKTILGLLEPLSGEIIHGSNLKIGYFAQAHEDLSDDIDLIDTISAERKDWLPAQIRNYLAKYQFRGDDVFKKVGVLSGGEKGRLSLALLALKGANFLLLDEPLNHLDISSQEILQSILKDYEGTILLVSHDRYLVDAIATQIWEIFPDEKRLNVFNGNYSQYKEFLSKKRAEQSQSFSRERKTAEEIRETGVRKPSNNQIRQFEKEKEALENQITNLENENNSLSVQLSSTNISYDKVTDLSTRYNNNQNELNSLYARWTAVEEKLQSFQ